MDRLLTAPNGPRLVIVAAALIARAMFGWMPLIGGLISFTLLVVVLYQVTRVAMTLVRASAGRT